MKIPKYLGPIGIAALLIAFCPVQTRANTIVFDTLGQNNTYGSIGLQVGFGGVESAGQFTAMASGILATVDLALNFTTGTTPGSVNVFLYGDAGGSPNNANQTFLGSGIATTAPNLVSFTVAGSVPVIMGSVYWLVLKPADLFEHTVWNDSLLAVTGSVAQSTDDITWTTFNDETLPAFRITAQGVPDSGGTLLIMLGSVAALLVLQRIASKRVKLSSNCS
jgi:hypothetical protein